MEVTVLGYWGGYPSAGGATSGYLISLPAGNLLLDCGSGVMSRLPYYSPIEKVKYVILSHLHHDHVADVGIFQYAVTGALRNKRLEFPVTIVCPTEPALMRTVLEHESSQLVNINPKLSLQFGTTNIEFMPVRHTIPAYAVKITCDGKVMVYSADTCAFDGLAEFAKGADLFICEATIAQGSVHTTGRGHMDAREAGSIAELAGAQKLLLTHLPHDGYFEEMKRMASEIFSGEVLLATEVTSIRL